MTLVAVAKPKAGTGFGVNVTGSVMSVTCTARSLLLVTSHVIVV